MVVDDLPESLLVNPFAAWEPPGTALPVAMRVAEGLAPRLEGGDDELVAGLRWTDHLPAALAAARAEPPVPWGELHRLVPRFALRGAAPDLDAATTVATPPMGGGRDCVFATAQADGIATETIIGSTARYVWDLSDRANSRWIVPLGASGDPASPHLADQLPFWARGELIPVIDRPAP
jgi:penicillin amidase